MKKLLLCNKIYVAFLILFSVSIFSQEIKGKVVDANGEPIPFASVIEKGTTNGVETNMEGEFIFNAKKLPVKLVFSSVGFSSVEKNITSKSEITIILKEDSNLLEEVVISGLATSVKRKNSANSVASISAKELTGVAPPQTLDGALSGKFTGAIVTSNSGAPGGGMSVKLRGITSINGNSQPLYIIDGVYVNNSSISSGGLNTVSKASGGGNASSQDNATNRIADINPDDIENIEILKGASAAAIYGSRGAAGVVIITTKKGKTGAAKINFSTSVGYNEIINLQGQRKWTEELVEKEFPGQGAIYAKAKSEGKLIDYEKEIFGRKGFVFKNNLSMSGGSKKTKYYAGISSSNEDGIVKKTGYDKTSVRLNLGHEFSDKVKISLNTNYIHSSADRGFFNNDNSGTTIGVALTATRPWDYLLPDEKGNFPDHPNNASNPLQTIDLMTNNEKVNRFILGGELNINILETENSNLKFIGRGGIDNYTLLAKVLFPKELQFQRKENGGLNGVTGQTTTTNSDKNFSGFLVHNYNTENNIRFNTQAGLTNEIFSQNVVRVVTSDLIASETNLDQGANQNVNHFRLEQEDFGFFAQESINFKDQLIATLGIRGDKSTNNGDANQFFYYPKASLAANLHNFSFWNESRFVNRLKLRGAYGEAGTFARFGSLFTVYGNTLIDGNVGITIPSTKGNPNILPERQKELELGFETGMFNNKLSLDFTWYKKSVEDLLLLANKEPSSGFSSEWQNAGELQNTGIEIGLKAKLIEKEDLNWDTGISWYKNKSKMTKLNVPAYNTGGFGTSLGTFRIEEGKSVTQIVGTTKSGGEIKVLGDAEPDFQMSFNNNLKYKNLTLSFLIHWKKGGDNINLSKLLSDFGKTSNDYDETTLDPEGKITNGVYRKNNGLFAGNATPFVEDASYIRLREIGLYYTFSNKLLDKAFNGKVSNLKLGASGTNLLNFFDYNSYDPEVSNFGGNGLSTGVEVTPFPSSKRLMFHLSAQF